MSGVDHIDAATIRRLLDEGRELRRELDRRVAQMRVLTPEILAARAK